MVYKPIQIKGLTLYFSHKTVVEDFNCQITYGSRIALIGKNGSGKSTLLKVMAGIVEPAGGTLYKDKATVIGYVPQIIEDYANLSGGQRLNTAITEALRLDPNVLLLDEPTNHLDKHQRKSLMCLLQAYSGTLIIASHDTELLRNCMDTLWHMDNGAIHIFSGNYDDYIHKINLKRASIESDLERLSRQRKDMHNKLMQTQERASKRKAYGEKKYAADKLALRAAQGSGQNSCSKKKAKIRENKEALFNQLESLRQPALIKPKFFIANHEVARRSVVQISGGLVGYCLDHPLLSDINLTLSGQDRLALAGDNGSGKSTLIKAILGDKSVHKTGEWYVVKREDIGYLDQHYSTLSPSKSVLETISTLVPDWSHAEVRRHLNDFLFRNNEEVNTCVHTLSGGEKARLTLAQIAANPPKLLLLDEITNNLDLETKGHVVQLLKAYPGAMIVISHDTDFLEKIGITQVVDVASFKL